MKTLYRAVFATFPSKQAVVLVWGADKEDAITEARAALAKMYFNTRVQLKWCEAEPIDGVIFITENS